VLRVARQLILDAVGRQILAHPAWRAAVHQAVQRAWRQTQSRPPRDQRRAQAALEDCDRRIRRLVDLLESSDQPDPALRQRLAERRQERAQWEQTLATWRAPVTPPREPPPGEWIDTQLAELGKAGLEGDVAGRDALRGLMTGPILVDVVSVTGVPRPIWRGTMSLIRSHRSAADAGDAVPGDALPVVLDFWRPRPKTETLMEQVWALSQQGHSGRDIARQLHVSTAWVSTLLTKAQTRFAAATAAVPVHVGPSRP
jgi:DNA-binding CsgD family transcriptional regulator